jgi:Icc-related predicted phosphoesterase
MKYILFSDIHCDRVACEQLVERSEKVDFAIGAGDFALMRRGLQETIGMLAGISVPTILVPGNHESHAELVEACEGIDNFHVLHGSEIELDGTLFCGIGGGIPVTPFGAWTVDFSEDHAQRLLSSPGRNFVFVTHSPPFGCLDTLCDSQHVGSKAIRSFVEEVRPSFVVCGHIHECASQQDEIEGIPVINAGPAGIEFEYPGRRPL